MDQVTFLSAQHLTIYYLWQINVCTKNLASKGVRKHKIHVLFALSKDYVLSAEELNLIASVQQQAMIFYYLDDRTNREYKSSVRPHIISKHFIKYPHLEKCTLFYHDCDILFRELPPLLKGLIHGTWYVSNTANYLDTRYIKSHISEDNFIKMCDLVKVDPVKVIEQDAHCGGAQYLMTEATAAFWKKVEYDCEAIYSFLQHVNFQNKVKNTLKEEKFQRRNGIQSWCADMWAVLWNAIYFKYTVKTHKDLNFCWPKNTISEWGKNYILHNAGIQLCDADLYFYKGNYIYSAPYFEQLEYIDKTSCSFVYAKAIKEITKDLKKIPLEDFSFLIPVLIDSEDRLNNLSVVVRYLLKHFHTNIIIAEYGRVQNVDPTIFSQGVKFEFIQSEDEILYRTHINNKMIGLAGTPYISIYDTDVILPISQMLESAQLLRGKKADMVYPYNGYFISMDKLSSVIFSKFLDDQFFEENKAKFNISSRRSVGGCVMLNKESFEKAGKENERFTSWGPEDKERYIRMKILGYTIKRVAGSLYHMHHARGKNSGYMNSERQIAFMEEYGKIFNMKKDELKEYVSTW